MTSPVEQLWAGWRSEYVAGSGGVVGDCDCVFCRLLGSDLDQRETNIVWRNELVAAMLNAYPYGTGHLLVMPVRHVADLEDLSPGESTALWEAAQSAVAAVKKAYHPDGANLGANLGSAAGAGIPSHLHLHVLPRWTADTNFMSAVANTRVLPEALEVTWSRLTEAWPK